MNDFKKGRKRKNVNITGFKKKLQFCNLGEFFFKYMIFCLIFRLQHLYESYLIISQKSAFYELYLFNQVNTINNKQINKREGNSTHCNGFE